MARQKVKGTGHKQPADASSEPNFYEMTPLEQAPSAITKLPSIHTVVLPPQLSTEPLKTTAPSPGENQKRPSHGFVLYERNEVSPGMQSVHGAAHLLQGIASGRNFALPPAHAQEDESRSSPQTSNELIANSFIPDMAPRNQEEV